MGSGRTLARQRLLTGAIAKLADLRKGSCAGECQHGGGEECVGSHVVGVVVLMLEMWKKSVLSWMEEGFERTWKGCMERECVGCEE